MCNSTYEERKLERTDLGNGIEIDTAWTDDFGYETARGFVKEIIAQLPAFPKGKKMKENIEFWLNLIKRAKEAYLQSLEDR